MKALCQDGKKVEDSGSGTADEETPSMIFDWINVNFGFLHFTILKKMFSSLGEDYTTGISGKI